MRPDDSIVSAWYAIDGVNPEPWEASQTAVGYRNGGHYVQHYKSEQLKAYQESVADLFKDQNPEHHFFEGPIELTFYLWRAMADYEVGDGQKSRAHQADATNCQKALEDALQGILFKNDRDVVQTQTRMMEQGADVTPRILIRINTAWPNSPHLDWVLEKYNGLVAAHPKIEKRSNLRRFNVEDTF